MPILALSLSLAGHGFAAIDASSGSPAGSRSSANLAAFLFGVIGILLFIFFMVVVLTMVSRALRRKRAATPNDPTDVTVDAWSEAGKRYGKRKGRRGRSEPS